MLAADKGLVEFTVAVLCLHAAPRVQLSISAGRAMDGLIEPVPLVHINQLPILRL